MLNSISSNPINLLNESNKFIKGIIEVGIVFYRA